VSIVEITAIYRRHTDIMARFRVRQLSVAILVSLAAASFPLRHCMDAVKPVSCMLSEAFYRSIVLHTKPAVSPPLLFD